MRITIVDRNKDLPFLMKGVGVDTYVGNVEDIPRTDHMAFVSPANSFCFMDGGIDYVYSRVMFPGVEAQVKRLLTKQTSLGRAFLSIGEALCVKAGTSPDVYLIMAPTMFFPQNVAATHNAYHATYAAVRCALDAGGGGAIEHLVIPGMCTGVGGMNAETAALQMKAAIADALAGRPAAYTAEAIRAEQPRNYANKEYFDTYGA